MKKVLLLSCSNESCPETCFHAVPAYAAIMGRMLEKIARTFKIGRWKYFAGCECILHEP